MAAAAASMAVAAKGDGEQEVSFFEDPCTWFRQWFCNSPFDNFIILAAGIGGVLCLIAAVAGMSHIAIAVVGGTLLIVTTSKVWALRKLAAEIDRFKSENDHLEETEKRLDGEIKFLDEKKTELTGHVSQLTGTVGELQNVSEGLQNELVQFQSLKGNIEKFAEETGADVKKILGEANKIHAKMEKMTNQNERALLGKIAQDIEFLDKDAGMGKEEFENFFARIPTHLQKRFKKLGLTFEKVAGSDGVIDFTEIEDMISKLMNETNEKIDSIHVI